jgi:hypothetical protein
LVGGRNLGGEKVTDWLRVPCRRRKLEDEMAERFIVSSLGVCAERAGTGEDGRGEGGHATNPGFEDAEVILGDGHHEEVRVDVVNVDCGNREHWMCSSVRARSHGANFSLVEDSGQSAIEPVRVWSIV